MKKFNYKELIKEYMLNKRLAKRSNDPSDSLMYENKANTIRYILELVKPRIRKPEYIDILQSDLAHLHGFGMYSPLVREFAENEMIEKEETQDRTINTKYGKLIGSTKNFFMNIKREYHDNVLSVMADNESIYRINKSLRGKYSGEVIPLADDKSFFIDMTLNGTIQDFLTFIHEFSHVNSLLMNSEHSNYNKSCLYETDTILMEMIGLDNLVLGYEESAINYTLDMFNDYVYSARIACAKMDLLNELSSTLLADKPYVYRYLEDKGYDKEEIQDILQSNIEGHFNYVVSYMVAIELYYKYKENKEEAIALLDEIIMMNCERAREYLEGINKLGINIGEHVNEYRSMLVERYNHGKGL